MSQRGSYALFNDLLEVSKPTTDATRKGRSTELHTLRNDCLIARYYFYVKYSGLRYSLILRILSKEFFLSEVTIPDILDANFEKLAALKKQPPDKAVLKEKWPHLNWNPTMVGLD